MAERAKIAEHEAKCANLRSEISKTEADLAAYRRQLSEI